ncbi:MAG: recombinase family protein [Ktedonobacterales bacterium]
MSEPRSRPRYQLAPLPRIAALYCRVSSKQQAEDDKTSLQTQLVALKAKAAELGYATAEQYIYTEAFSGEELLERPILSRLRDDAKARRFGLILAYNVYALAKNQAHMAILHDEWERRGIALDFVTEQLEDTPVGRAILALRTFAAEVECERRKDRFQRARQARAEGGRAAVAHRANYGYRWADTRLADGRLSRERLEVDPVTGPILVRMYELVDTGQTLRSIAALFTSEGIPTPTGKWAAWDPTSIRALLLNPLYCGQGRTLRSKSIPVEKSVRHLYARRTREVPRPREEQVALPPTYAPALVSLELFERVGARLHLNQQLAARNNRQPTATLARGLVRCAHCGYGMQVINGRPYGPVYRCQVGTHPRGGTHCPEHGVGIMAHKLDTAVWNAITALLREPQVVEHEVARLRETADPGAELLATIDRQIAEIDRRIRNKHQFAELVEDDQERGELAAEVSELRKARRVLEAERVAAAARTTGWRDQQQGLERLVDWCERVAGNLETFTAEERRNTLLTLHAVVAVYRRDHTPRAELTIHLPLSGALALSMGVCDSAAAAGDTTPASRTCGDRYLMRS